MSRWDDDATNVVADLIDEAIKRDDIQAALREATSGDTESYAAAAIALRRGAQIDEFLAAVPAEASTYRETIRIGLEELRAYLFATYEEYRVLCDLEENAFQIGRRKGLELEEMKARIVRVQAQEYAQGAGARRSSLFRRRTESEQLTYDYHDGLEELTTLRRKVADVATQRRRFELGLETRDPGQKARLEKAEGARNDLAMAVLEPVILPYLRSAIAKYAALSDNEAEGAHATAAWYPAEGTLEPKFRDRIDMAEEDDVVSQLEEVAPGKSAGIQGPRDKPAEDELEILVVERGLLSSAIDRLLRDATAPGPDRESARFKLKEKKALLKEKDREIEVYLNKDILIGELLRLSITNDLAGRTTLLGGMRADNLQRDGSRQRHDLDLIITQLARLGRDEHGNVLLVRLIDNALPYAEGSEVHTNLTDLRGEFSALGEEE